MTFSKHKKFVIHYPECTQIKITVFQDQKTDVGAVSASGPERQAWKFALRLNCIKPGGSCCCTGACRLSFCLAVTAGLEMSTGPIHF